MTGLRCWLFGHDWLHLETSFTPEKELASQHLCERCGAERAIVFTTWYLDADDEDEITVSPDEGVSADGE